MFVLFYYLSLLLIKYEFLLKYVIHDCLFIEIILYNIHKRCKISCDINKHLIKSLIINNISKYRITIYDILPYLYFM